MLIRDRIYGSFTITEPVILELLKSAPVRRLKGISQLGVPDKYHYSKGFSRYEHSIGVMLLLRRLGASLEEQIAGLLHDVSHTAFSHVVDWVVGERKTENFQDDRHLQVLTKSELAKILKKYGYNPRKIADLHSFKLLDNDIPNLCADRIDYSLRCLSLKDLKRTSNIFKVDRDKIIIKDKKSALLFANSFLDCQIEQWGGFEGVCRYEIFSTVLQRAIELRIIKLEDFYGDEESILSKVEASKDKIIRIGIKTLSNKSLSKLPLSDKKITKKFRFVDPEYIENGRMVRVSETFPRFVQKLERAKKANEVGIQVVSWL